MAMIENDNSAADRRSQILAASVKHARQAGLSSLSIGELASAIGMSKSGLYAHFKSKENLQRAVLQAAAEQFNQLVIIPALQSPRGEPRIRKLWEKWCDWHRMEGECIFMLSVYEFDARPGPVRDYLRSTQLDWIETVERVFLSAQTEGHFRLDIEKDVWAYEFHCLGSSVGYFTGLLQDKSGYQKAQKAFEALVMRSRVPAL